MEGIERTMGSHLIETNIDNKAGASLPESVKRSLQTYFSKVDMANQMPNDVWEMVMSQVEKPLISMVLKVTNGNQSKAARILGISRGTLRKKMAIYQIQ